MSDTQLDSYTALPLDQLMDAINGLLRKSLLTISNVKGKQTYTAISRSEASLIGSLDTDETIIYQHIKEGGDRGIWTKSLKARSNLHQTVMTRVLKNLEQRQLVKVVKDVKVSHEVLPAVNFACTVEFPLMLHHPVDSHAKDLHAGQHYSCRRYEWRAMVHRQ